MLFAFDRFSINYLVLPVTAYVSGDFCSVFSTDNSVSMCQVILNIQRVEVKGYHKCPFSVEVGERFVAQKKTGDLFISVAL